MIGTISDSGALIGMEKGYYREEGIDVQVERFDTGPAQIPPLAAGQLEVASPTADPSTFNAAARGIPLRVVADKGSMPPGFGFNAVLVRKDLADSGAIRDWPDLRGMRIAYLANGTTPQVDLALALERGGLSPTDVTTFTMPFPDMNVALSNRALDVALSIEPFVAIAVAQGIATRWKGLDELYPGQQVAVLTYGPRFVAENPDVARRFMVGYLRAVRYYNDAFVKNDAAARADAVSILTRHTAMRDPALYDQMVYPYLNPNGYVNADSIRSDFEWFRRDGQIEGRVDVDTVLDNTYVDYALDRLGRYE
jgi:NitT/TauT family transport system substrate-binding protein